MPNVLKKFIFSFLTVLIVLFSFAPYFSPAKAQTWYNQSFQEWYGKVYDPTNPNEIFGERYTAAQVQWIIYGLFGFLINSTTGQQNSGLMQCFISNVTNMNTCLDQLKDLLIDKGAHKSTMEIQNSILATTKVQPQQNIWSLVFASDRPISGISYVKNNLEKYRVISVVRAQSPGTGFLALAPIHQMWIAFRDISYGFFIIIAIIFAFMIMFRVKLSPQTVISVQSALPKIIISLILVTFSYAIAGFLIDLMYLVIGLVSIAGSQIIKVGSPTNWFNLLTLGQPTGINVNLGAFGLLLFYLLIFVISLASILFMYIGALSSAIMGVVAVLLLGTGFTEVMLLIGIIIIIIATIVACWMLLKILWSLLKAFANVLLLTIFAPIQLTLGAVIPNFGFGAWVKNYVSNLAVFVVTGALILFSYIFLLLAWQTAFSDVGDLLITLFFGTGATGTVKGLFGSGIAGWPPLLNTGGNAGLALLFVMVSFVIFTLIPKANDIIQSFLSGKPFAYGTAIGEAFGPVKWAGSQAYNQTGAKDLVDMMQRLRKGRFMENWIGQGRPLRGTAESLMGGERPGSDVDNTIKSFKTHSN